MVAGKDGKDGGNGGAPANWPSRGTVVFDNVWMKYSPTAHFALKGVTFSLSHSDKVGVVGRTGSGKSTLLLALYRVFDLEKGAIYVDGVDVASLTLKRLRCGLSIIPQVSTQVFEQSAARAQLFSVSTARGEVCAGGRCAHGRSGSWCVVVPSVMISSERS